MLGLTGKHLGIKRLKHHDAYMRTTLTLDDDLALRLKEIARQAGKSFKEVTNETIRRGLSVGESSNDTSKPFRVIPKAFGFRPGIDPLKLNQIFDDLEIERISSKGGYGVHEP
jgi:hypothetical protein